MASRHVDSRFSEAFDGMLDDAGRHRFDDHLAGCARCRDAFADYAAALQAVRELPAARMPVPVGMPATAPQLAPEPRSPRWTISLQAWLLHPAPAVAGLGLAAAGIAAVILAVHVGHGGNLATNQQTGGTALQQNESAGAGSNAGGQAPAAAGPARLTAPNCAFRIPAAAGGGAPQGFDNAVRQSDPSRPGQQLILATSGAAVHAGDSVTVYARLITAGSDTAIVPCVSLVGGTEGASVAAPQSAGSSGGAGAGGASSSATSGQRLPAPPVPGQAAQPTAQPTTYGSLATAPLLSIAIPAGLPPGTVLHLVAEVPASVPNASNATVEAVLTITVS